ncbi:MAG: hypothetical protein FWH48_09355 [Oscillospiraceae bacterium]|nr:hypothetical protein [Oscillospiraceae bacterium]
MPNTKNQKKSNVCDGQSFVEETDERYLKAVKLAAYEPESSISRYVMDKIIGEKIAIQKPRKKIFVPFGLISAAAIVLALFVLTRGGALEIFTKSDLNAQSANLELAADMGMDEGFAFETAQPEAAIAKGEADMDMETGIEMNMDMVLAEAVEEPEEALLPEEAAPAPAAELAERAVVGREYKISRGEFERAGGDILKGIEIYSDKDGYYIIESQYREALEKNLGEQGIEAKVKEIDAGGEGYIALIID